MGKIEDCFGSLEAGEAFAISAYEQPILRLLYEVRRSDGGNVILANATAGIVAGISLEVPSDPIVHEPSIAIAPASMAAFEGPFAEHMPLTNPKTASYRLWQDSKLLIVQPVQHDDEIAGKVKDLFRDNRVGLTVVRAPLIRHTLDELLSFKETGNDRASMLHYLAGVALHGMWDAIPANQE